MKRRFLAVLLALALCVGLAPAAFAAEEEFVIDENGVLVEYNGPGGDVVIPDGVTSIEEFSFHDRRASLTSVTIPNSVTSIGIFAFEFCANLTSVTIGNGVTSIGGCAFRFCTGLTDIVIPDSVTYIGSQAFAYCENLTSVTIPASVKEMGPNVFDIFEYGDSIEIYSTLKDVYYGGAKEQWDAISMVELNNGDKNYALETATIHYNSGILVKFPDLKPNGFYVDAVEWAVANGITTGKTATTFAPDLKCSHSEILTFLWRAAGEPESSAKPPIAMKGSEFYYKAVKWAAEKGMIGANFNPSAPCTRAYAVQYIWQAMGKPAPSKASPFTDIPAHWSSAKAAAWAAEKGITTGTSATTFNPGGICNRGQIVTFLYRAYK